MLRGFCSTCVVVAATLAATGDCTFANPRDSHTFTNFNSALGQPGAGIGSMSTGIYVVRYIRIQGTLQALVPSARGQTQLIVVEPIDTITSSNSPPPFSIGVSGLPTLPGSLNVDRFVRVPQPYGTSPFINTVIEARDLLPTVGAGPDARWSTLTITLNDGPPAPALSLGPVTQGTRSVSVQVPASGAAWIRLEVPAQIASGSGTYLDIDTIGSSLATINDTVLVLYDEDGNRIAIDDDSGGGSPARQSLLSFGAGTRPSVGNSAPYAGQNGALPPGTYYLGIRGWNFPFDAGGVGWDFPSTSTYSGTARVNFRTNVGTPANCPGDFNKDGSVAVQDIFDFLNSWFAGCP